jgi:acyl-CoA thioester hydrolase
MYFEKFRFNQTIEVRFADLDVLGHLNNATYLTFIEQARILYIQEVCGWSGEWQRLGMILARTEIDYKLPVTFGDVVVVFVRTSHIGNKSFDLEYLMSRQRGADAPQIVAAAKTVMVAYDYAQETSISVPQAWREAMFAYESALSSPD